MYNLRTRKQINCNLYSKKKDKSNSKVTSKYKVYVFDLDDTLYLHTNNDDKYKTEYHIKVKKYLLKLKTQNKIICLATHNKDPMYYLKKINIEKHMFDHVVYELKNVNSSVNKIHEYTSKRDMIMEIMVKTGYKKNKVIFFDDSDYNIDQVQSIGVKSIKVSRINGLNLD